MKTSFIRGSHDPETAFLFCTAGDSVRPGTAAVFVYYHHMIDEKIMHFAKVISPFLSSIL